MTLAAVKPQKIPPSYHLDGAYVRITTNGGLKGMKEGLWGRIAQIVNSESDDNRINIRVLHPDSGELLEIGWRTDWVEPLLSGEQVDEVATLRIAIASSDSQAEGLSQEAEGENLLVFTSGETRSEEEDGAEMRSVLRHEERSPTIEVTEVEVVEELSPEEESDRLHLERKVERAFYEAGVALRKLRDRKLYRSTHKTFEAYCQDRFGFSRRRPYQLIDAANVMENLCTIGTQILPTSERQVRDLFGHEASFQQSAWTEAVEANGGKVPPARLVKSVVERLKAKPLISASHFCSVGDAFTLIRLTGRESKYNGCWAIAIALNDFTVEVDVHDGTLIVKPENLQPIDSPQERRELPAIVARIKRLRNMGLLDRGAYTMLESFGKQTYLTDLEDKVLSFMEQYYGLYLNLSCWANC
jgi:hypothetical protein